VADRIDGAVRLVGHAQRPGDYQWKPDMRLTDLIGSVADLQPGVDARYLLIRREDPRDQSISFVSADLMAALAQPDSDANVLLQPRDEIHVFAIQAKRDALVKPLLDQARLRTAPNRLIPEVVIEGVVHHPGTYPYSTGMRAGDLLRAGGGLTDRAYTVEAELTRFNVVEGKEREQSRMTIDVAAVLKGDADKNVSLQPYDRLVIRRIPKWDEEGVIEIVGEVRFPGKYPIGRKETLASVIERAGGMTEQAYPKGAIFLRESVRQREQEHLERLVRDLERDLAVVATQGEDIGVKKEQALAEGRVLLQQLRSATAAGRMVIRLDRTDKARDAAEAIIVQGGDRLYIPRQPQEVTVLGEVYYPTSHLYKRDMDSGDYVRISGGVTEKGNKGAIYVVHADGSVSPPGGWFTPNPDIGPGDTIVVPLKLERIGSWQLFKDAAQILFQLAVTVAALDAIGVF
jgi:protein involved in polysaccharide export with SLBB domain